MADPVRVFRPPLIILQDTARGGLRLFAETQGTALNYEPSISERLTWIEQLASSVKRELAIAEQARPLKSQVKED